MKSITKKLMISALPMVLAFNALFSQEAYVSGVEGILCGSIPPPGLYLKEYLLYYKSNHAYDCNGAKSDLTVKMPALVNRFIWITNTKILGADYGMDVILPVIHKDIVAAPGQPHLKLNGLGDTCIEPVVLSWHGSQWDLAFAMGGFLPTGKVMNMNGIVAPQSTGQGYCTGMVTVGATYFFDSEKTWSASILPRYEIHNRQQYSGIKPGNDFHFEYGVAKQFIKVLQVGVAGFCEWQTTCDSNATKKAHVFAAGPEIQYSIPSWQAALSAKFLCEFNARGTTTSNPRPKGSMFVFSFTKIF